MRTRKGYPPPASRPSRPDKCKHRVNLRVANTEVVLVVYLSLTPDPVTFPTRVGDKLAHAFAYFVLMSWFANLYSRATVRAGFAAGFVALGVALEFVQLRTGLRLFEVTDMAVGALGVAGGWLAAPPRLPNYLSLAEKVWRVGWPARS